MDAVQGSKPWVEVVRGRETRSELHGRQARTLPFLASYSKLSCVPLNMLPVAQKTSGVGGSEERNTCARKREFDARCRPLPVMAGFLYEVNPDARRGLGVYASHLKLSRSPTADWHIHQTASDNTRETQKERLVFAWCNAQVGDRVLDSFDDVDLGR